MATHKTKSSSSSISSQRSTPSKSRSSTKSDQHCKLIVEGLQLSYWLKPVHTIEFTNIESSDKIIKLYEHHIKSPCSCVSNSVLHLINGIAFFEKFLAELKEFYKQVALLEDEDNDEASKPAKSLDDPRETAPTANLVVESMRPSRFSYNVYAQCINLESQKRVLTSFYQAMSKWEKGIESNTASSIDFARLKLAAYLNDAFYVANCYRLVDQQEKCVNLLYKVSLVSGHNADKLNVFTLSARSYLDKGQIQKARKMIENGEEYEKRLLNSNMIDEPVEFYLFKLIKWELQLGTDKENIAAKELKLFIGSDYLKKSTLNRFYLKGVCFLLATYFNANNYEFSRDHSEFQEPISMGSCLVKRFHKSLYSNAKDVETNDQTWVRFAAYSLALRSIEVLNEFLIGSGTPLDLMHYYQSLFSLCRRQCFVHWLQQLLIIGARIDDLSDKRDCAVLKLESLFILTAVDYRRKTVKFKRKQSSNINEQSNDELEVYLESHRNSGVSSESPQASDCMHHFNYLPWSKRKTFISKANTETDENNFLTKLPPFTASEFNIHEAELTHIEAAVLLMRLICERRIKDVLNMLPMTINPLEAFAKKVNVSLSSKGYSNSQYFHKLNAQLVEYLMCVYMQSNQLKAASSVALQFFKTATTIYIETYPSRILFASIASKFLATKYRIMALTPKRLEFDMHILEERLLSNQQVKVVSPTRKTGKRERNINAPKKELFKQEGLQEYFKELNNAFYETRQTRSTAQQSSSSSSRTRASNMFEAAFVRSAKKSNKENKPSNPSTSKELGRNRSVNELPELLSKTSILSGLPNTPVSKMTNYFNSLDISPCKGNTTITIFKKTSSAQNVADLKDATRSIVLYFGSHPPVHLYTEICDLLSELYLNKDIFSKRMSGYYFSESATAASLRYKALRILEKKSRRKTASRFDSSHFSFGVHNEAAKLDRELSAFPDGWRAIQIKALNQSSAEISDLFITRYEKGAKPIFVRIKANPEKFKKDFMQELKEIIELSNVSILDKNTTSFWKVRFSLDNRLRVLLNSVETAWLGPFKAFFVGKVQDKTFTLMCQSMVDKVVEYAKSKRITLTDVQLLSAIVESYPILSENEMKLAISALFDVTSSNIIDSIHNVCEIEFRAKYPEVDKRVDLMASFRKAPVGMILSKHCDQFPFESLPILKSIKQEIFRMPSLLIMSSMLQEFNSSKIFINGANEFETFYVINPANNLDKTQELFKDRFEQKTQWEGVINKPPKPTDLAKALESKDIYIFFGHGTGTTYYRQMPDNIEGLSLNSTNVVIGCSSGKLSSDGTSLESYGTAYRFLLNGAPCFAGVLWDVTDRDIDKFADKMLEEWLPSWNKDVPNLKTNSIVGAFTEAREVCKLKYLIGAAPVVYGLPIHSYVKL